MRELTNDELQVISGGADIFEDVGHAIGTVVAKAVKFVKEAGPVSHTYGSYTL